MKGSIASSVAIHAVVLGLGLVSLSSPRSLDVSVESVSVDIVPLEENSQVLIGDKKAPMTEKPAPLPTTRPQTEPEAQKVGDNDIDTDKPPVPDAKPKPVEAAQAPAPQPKPETPVKKEEEKKVEETKPAPPVETAAVEPPKPEPTPEPEKQPEAKPVENTVTEAPAENLVRLPDSAPAPQSKPKPEPQPAKEAASKPKTEDSQFNEDEIAALLSKEKTAGGGAKRSSEQASLGGRQNNGTKLSRGDEDALRNQLSGCWTIPAGAEGGDGLRVKVAFNVDQGGRLDGPPRVEQSSGNAAFDRSAVRAVQICDQQGLQLPAGMADVWSEIAVNFDPSEMF